MASLADSVDIDPHKVTWTEWYGLVPGMKFRVGYWNPEKQQMFVGDEWLFLQGDPTVTLKELTLPARRENSTEVFNLRLLVRHQPKFLIITA